MIQPPGRSGVAFTSVADGDMRSDADARALSSDRLSIPVTWATAKQVHGSRVREATVGGNQGEADALWTRRTGLPLAVFTADCFGVVLHAEGAVGVAHAGWRGVAAGVVGEVRAEMAVSGFEPSRAEIGPGIGACCFEVGEEVGDLFPSSTANTTWGTASVDLALELSTQLEGLDTWLAGGCTRHQPEWFSHRENQTPERMSSIGWVT